MNEEKKEKGKKGKKQKGPLVPLFPFPFFAFYLVWGNYGDWITQFEARQGRGQNQKAIGHRPWFGTGQNCRSWAQGTKIAFGVFNENRV